MAPRKATAENPSSKKASSKKSGANKAAPKKSSAKAGSASARKPAESSPAAKAPEDKANSKPVVSSKVLVKKKPTPVSFSLEDVQSALEDRKTRQAATSQPEVSATPPPPAQDTPPPAPKVIPVDQPVERRKHQAASLADILGFNPAQKKSETELDEETVPKKWLKYYRLLIELRNEVKNELDLHTSDTLKRSSREDSGDLSGYGQHQADAATDSFDRDFALSILSAEQDALYEIAEAIKRIKLGNYGLCEVTGEPIPKERLTAVPFTRFSIEGQREFEKNRRRKADRGGAFADTSDAVSLAGEDDGDD